MPLMAALSYRIITDSSDAEPVEGGGMEYDPQAQLSHPTCEQDGTTCVDEESIIRGYYSGADTREDD
jgi:hypothetical protein